MSTIRVPEIRVQNGELRCTIECSGYATYFVKHTEFVARYNVNIEEVPRSVLMIPLVSNLAPALWAKDIELEIPALDPEFRRAQERVRDVLSGFYPEIGFSGGSIVTNDEPRQSYASQQEGSGMLYSGGVDSLTTYIRHSEDSPALITLQGNDIGLDQQDAWNEVKQQTTEFADARDLEAYFVRSNFREFQNMVLLDILYKYGGGPLDASWWANVQHGMGILGLCAPLAYATGLGTLYLASTHTEEYNRPWGSHPGIDDNVSWQGTTCEHDAYDMSRQEKWEVIARFFEENPDMVIRSCSQSETGKNCNECFTCARNVVGMTIAGLDPESYGYELEDETFDRIRRRFEQGEWYFGSNDQFMWRDMQRHLPEEIADLALQTREAEEFFEWLATVELDELAEIHECERS